MAGPGTGHQTEPMTGLGVPSGKDLGPETGVSPMWTEKQTENITFPRTS